MAKLAKFLQGVAGAAGGEALNVEDVFSTYLYEGNGSGQVIENGVQNLGDYPTDNVYLHLTGTTTTDNGPLSLTVNTVGNATTSNTQTKFTSSSLYVDGTGAGDATTCFDIQEGQISLGRKDFTIEYWVYHNAHNSYADFGSWNYYVNGYDGNFGGGIGGSGTQLRLFKYDGQSNNAVITGTVSTSLNTWYHVAISRSNGTVYLFLDGTLITSGAFDHDLKDAEIGGITIGKLGSYEQVDAYFSDFRITIGEGRYTSSFTAPTAALPIDTLTDGEGGMVWIKERDATSIPIIYDTDRGVGKLLRTNDTNAETDLSASSLGITAYNSNGFSLGGTTNNDNDSGINHASWTFRKAPKFFDVVTYTGNSFGLQVINHNLGVTPGMIIIKKTSSTQNWAVWHKDLGANQLALNTTGAAADDWYAAITLVTDTSFRVGVTPDGLNDNGATYVAYLFAHNDGDGEFGPNGDADIIKCGSFTSDGSGGVSVDLGFEPQWIMYKPTSTTGPWVIVDSMRGWTANSESRTLTAESSGAEQSVVNLSSSYPLNRRSNGFDTSNALYASQTYIYIAIRRGPMAVPESATDVFAIDTLGGTSPTPPGFNSGFPIDMAIYKHKGNTTDFANTARLIQAKYLITNNTNSEADFASLMYDYQDGYFNTTSTDSQYLSWMWKRAPSFCDVVAYTGAGATQTINHNLGVKPEAILIKQRSGTTGWIWWYDAFGDNQTFIRGDLGNATFTNTTYFNNTAPTDTQITLGFHGNVSGSTSTNYIAYLFASLDGVSKVGSYTGTGATLNIDCGFSSGARFILIKRTDDSPYDWFVWDSERGIVAGNDPRLALNLSNAEVTTQDDIDPYSSGFTISSTSPGINTSGGSYIFYAIA